MIRRFIGSTLIVAHLNLILVSHPLYGGQIDQFYTVTIKLTRLHNTNHDIRPDTGTTYIPGISIKLERDVEKSHNSDTVSTDPQTQYKIFVPFITSQRVPATSVSAQLNSATLAVTEAQTIERLTLDTIVGERTTHRPTSSQLMVPELMIPGLMVKSTLDYYFFNHPEYATLIQTFNILNNIHLDRSGSLIIDDLDAPHRALKFILKDSKRLKDVNDYPARDITINGNIKCEHLAFDLNHPQSFVQVSSGAVVTTPHMSLRGGSLLNQGLIESNDDQILQLNGQHLFNLGYIQADGSSHIRGGDYLFNNGVVQASHISIETKTINHQPQAQVRGKDKIDLVVQEGQLSGSVNLNGEGSQCTIDIGHSITMTPDFSLNTGHLSVQGKGTLINQGKLGYAVDVPLRTQDATNHLAQSNLDQRRLRKLTFQQFTGEFINVGQIRLGEAITGSCGTLINQGLIEALGGSDLVIGHLKNDVTGTLISSGKLTIKQGTNSGVLSSHEIAVTEQVSNAGMVKLNELTGQGRFINQGSIQESIKAPNDLGSLNNTTQAVQDRVKTHKGTDIPIGI